MANLITQLKRSGYFDNVEIKTAVEDDIVPSVETYNFSMSAAIAASATGGVAPLQYQFWRRSTTGSWILGQAYSTTNTYTWTPGSSDGGSTSMRRMLEIRANVSG